MWGALRHDRTEESSVLLACGLCGWGLRVADLSFGVPKGGEGSIPVRLRDIDEAPVTVGGGLAESRGGIELCLCLRVLWTWPADGRFALGAKPELSAK